MGDQQLLAAGVRHRAGSGAAGQEEQKRYLPSPRRHLLQPHQALHPLRLHAGLSRQRRTGAQTLITTQRYQIQSVKSAKSKHRMFLVVHLADSVFNHSKAAFLCPCPSIKIMTLGSGAL